MPLASKRLVHLRKILGLSQRDMAHEFQVSAGAIGSWETGEREIPGPVLKLIEIYEGECLSLSFSRSSQSTNAEASLGDEMLKSFTSHSSISNKECLSMLHEALKTYGNEISSENKLQSHVQGLALKKLISAIGETRGLPMKAAQIASFLDPRVTPELREALATIQNQGRAMPYYQVAGVIEEEFDCAPDELFHRFSRRPVACASIGQVHRAELKDGTQVAVKVQYPEISQQCEVDFADIDFLQQLSYLIGEGSQALIEDFRKTLISECDFNQEARHQERFRKIFSSEPDVIIPEVFLSHSRKRVLTTTWVDGQSWQDFRTSAGQEQRDRAAKIISQFYAVSTFAEGLVHVDPHPGNYIFTNDKVAFIDFGRVKVLEASVREELHRLHALLIANEREQMRIFVQSSKLLELGPCFDFDLFWRAATLISRHLRHEGQVPFTKECLVEYRSVVKELARSGSIRISRDFFWTILVTHTIMLSGRADLGASGDWRAVLRGQVH